MTQIKEYQDYLDSVTAKDEAKAFALDIANNGHTLRSVRVQIISEAPDGSKSTSKAFDDGIELVITEDFTQAATRAVQKLRDKANADGVIAKAALDSASGDIIPE